jgi:hypothetical protein
VHQICLPSSEKNSRESVARFEAICSWEYMGFHHPVCPSFVCKCLTGLKRMRGETNYRNWPPARFPSSDSPRLPFSPRSVCIERNNIRIWFGKGIDRQQLLGLCGMFVSGPEQPSASFQRSARSVKKKTTWYIYRVRHVLGVKVR